VRSRQVPNRCWACTALAGYAFLAVTGNHADRIEVDGKRLRACPGHLMPTITRINAALDRLPGPGPDSIRAVPLGPPS